MWLTLWCNGSGLFFQPRQPQPVVSAEQDAGGAMRGILQLHEAQVLPGLLRYACGFFAGRNLHQVCAEIMAMGTVMLVSRTQLISVIMLRAVRARAFPKTWMHKATRDLFLFSPMALGRWKGRPGCCGCGYSLRSQPCLGWNRAWSAPREVAPSGWWTAHIIELYAIVALRWNQMRW